MNKPVILVITPEMGGGGGCFYHRIATLANHINATPQYNTKVVVTPFPIMDTNLLANTRCILFQRPVIGAILEWIKRYKELQPKFGYSLVGELDDLFTEFHGESIPDYNGASLSRRDFTETDRIVAESVKYLDRMIVSTLMLERVYNEKFNYWNTVVLENAAPRSLYNTNRKTFFRDKPIVITPSGKQHCLQPIPINPQYPTGVAGLRGDYTGEWVEFLKDNIKNDKIDYIEMAGVSYFLDEVADKIQTTPWFDTPNYAGFLCRTQPDIIMAPLANNVFVKCKSCLKFVESCALGAVMMGSYFEGSPYERIHPLCRVPDNPTREQLEKVFADIKANWKEILDYQYNFINSHGDWIESNDHVMKWLNACSPQNQVLV